jgi:hypothetical protein
MRTITAKAKYSDQEIKKLEGYFIQDHHYDEIIDYDCDGYKEDGSPLFFFRKNVIPASICEQAYKNLRTATAKGGNRGSAGGVPPDRKNTNTMNLRYDENGELVPEKTTGKTRGFKIKKDGTISRFHSAFQQVDSGIAGYFDRQVRFPYCRQTMFNMNKFDKFKKGYPYIKYVNDIFKEVCPTRYKAQEDMVNKTSPDFYIKGTVFTTITINKNFRTAIHTDKGDVRSGDVCFFDVHEFHGNTEIKAKGNYERISIVCYYRKNMINCKSAQEELEIAKRLQDRKGLNK